MTIIAPKKLIEVALPLDDINKAAAREKSIRHGHPSTLHLWWARRPLAAARAVLFAQLVNDPSWKYSDEDLKKPQIKSAITRKRNELFKLISELVKWENTTNETVLGQARAEIRASWRETCEANKAHPEAATLFNPEKLPAFHDPFAGGGAIPLEAQRLGLESHATDLNPVAVLINKAMIEIPPKFAGRAPVNPDWQVKSSYEKAANPWRGAQGVAADVRYYGQWMRDEAEKRIGHLYPKVEITAELAAERPDLKPMQGRQLTVIAWLWARTVKSPNPAFANVDVPLVSTFILANKAGKVAYVDPVVEGGGYRFAVRVGDPEDAEQSKLGTKLARANFRCLLSGAAITGEYIKAEGKAKRIGARLMAVVAEGDRERVYLAPTESMARVAVEAAPDWKPEGDVPARLTGGTCVPYGLEQWGELFTARQLVALTAFSDMAQETRARVEIDAVAAGMADDRNRLRTHGEGATAYADAVATYLGLAMSRFADRNNSLCTWDAGPLGTKSSTGGSARTASIRNLFSRQAIPMAWDYAEANPFSDSGGSYTSAADWIVPAVAALTGTVSGASATADAARQQASRGCVVSTDPPYYDNIGYADLSDFFYVWLRRSLKPIFPELFATIVVPKAEELVATAYRHGGREKAEAFFLTGMTEAMHRIAEQAERTTPITIYYAFKQSDTDADSTSSTGWETFLGAVSQAGLRVVGTWPMRTELANRLVGMGTNALASSIVLVCRPRDPHATSVSRKDFVRELGRALPKAIAEMTADPIASIAPVDLAQACIGPGMALFSKHKAVLEAGGEAMSVHNALVHINKAIDEYFAEAEGDLDADTRFAIGWFEEAGFSEGEFGKADVLARAKGTSVEGLSQAGVLAAGKGKVRLIAIKDLPKDWDPLTDMRLPIWEALHHLCRALGQSEADAGALLGKMQEKQEPVRQLAYRLYTLAERKGWAEEARAYNRLITSWPSIVEASQHVVIPSKQGTLGL
jgi:putative DNA methylase